MPPGRLYIEGHLAVGRQIQSFAEGIGVGEGHLLLHVDMTPVAGSRLARWVATIESPSPATGVANLPGAIFSAAAHLGDLSLIREPYFRYMEQLLGIMGRQMPADSMTDYLESLKAYWENSGSDFGLAVLPPTREAPLRMAEYLSVRNPAALRGLNARMIGAANNLFQASMATAPSQPFTFELVAGESREYREIPVDRMTYRLTAGPDMAKIWPEGRTLELGIEQAWLPDGVLVGIGGSDITDQLVDRALDGAAAPISDLDAWKAFFPRPGSGGDGRAAVLDGLREYLGLLDSVTGEEMVQAILAAAATSPGSPIARPPASAPACASASTTSAPFAQKAREAQQSAPPPPSRPRWRNSSANWKKKATISRSWTKPKPATGISPRMKRTTGEWKKTRKKRRRICSPPPKPSTNSPPWKPSKTDRSSGRPHAGGHPALRLFHGFNTGTPPVPSESPSLSCS